MTENECQKDGIDYRTAVVIPKSRVGIMPDATPLYFKLIFGYPSGEVLGAQALGKSDVLNGEFEQIQVKDVRKLVEKGAFIVDAREPAEYEEGHIKSAVNIPLSQFRQRLDEIPTDRPVYVHCLTGQRSYNMVRALNNRGYNNIINIDGSYLALCEYEYFKDQTTDRKPIVTNYRFDLL